MVKTIHILLAFWSFCFSGLYAQTTDVSIEKLFTVGAELSFGDPGYLLQPGSIATDRDGNIFISDRRFSTVNMYDPEGMFIISFGGRGRGPGEFSEVTNIEISESGDVLVLDRMSFKVARFRSGSRDVSEHVFEDIRAVNMMNLADLREDQFATIYVERPLSPGVDSDDVDSETDKAIRIYNFGNGTHQSSYLDLLEERIESDDPIEQGILGSPIGFHLTSMDPNRLAVAHRVYNGHLFLVNVDDGEIIMTENPEITPPFYYDFEERPDEEERSSIGGWISSSGPEGFYQILYATRLLDADDEHLFHIYRRYQIRSLEFSDYLEVYSRSGDLIIHVPLPERPSLAGEITARSQTLHLDRNHRLFITRRFNDRDPIVEVYQLRWN